MGDVRREKKDTLKKLFLRWAEFSQQEKAGSVVVLVLVGVVVGLVLSFFNINIFKPIIKTETTFVERTGFWSKSKVYSAKVTQIATIGENDHLVPPVLGCRDMVIDVELWIVDPKRLREELTPSTPRRVKSVEVWGQRIIVHRACIADDKKPFRSFSTWDQIWEEIFPVLKKHFEN